MRLMTQGRISGTSTRGILARSSWILAKSEGIVAGSHLHDPRPGRVILALGERRGVWYGGGAPVNQLLDDFLGRHGKATTLPGRRTRLTLDGLAVRVAEDGGEDSGEVQGSQVLGVGHCHEEVVARR